MKNKSIALGMRASSLLTIFVILCLTIFATLTYLQARSNYTLSNRYIETRVLYYEADKLAREKLFELNEIANNLDKDYFITSISKQGYQVKNNQINYEIIITDKSVLSVIIGIIEEDNKLVLNVLNWKWDNDEGNYGHQGFDY